MRKSNGSDSIVIRLPSLDSDEEINEESKQVSKDLEGNEFTVLQPIDI